uniref:Astacin-like peptidase p16 (Fragments) n=1 Tax=Argiope aurantia TaxID=156844 RepID=PEP16_ARGAU|nr:RecName: Full=Astacin-like peptidase p16 [Argiope aurantia]
NAIPGQHYRWPGAKVPYVIDSSLQSNTGFIQRAFQNYALGFYHEQNRSDRDDYLIIYVDNVQKGMEFNFAKLAPSQNILYTTFDYGSIMIYGNDAFSRDGSPM